MNGVIAYRQVPVNTTISFVGTVQPTVQLRLGLAGSGWAQLGINLTIYTLKPIPGLLMALFTSMLESTIIIWEHYKLHCKLGQVSLGSTMTQHDYICP